MTLNRKNNHTNGISVFKLVKNEILHEILGLLWQNIKIQDGIGSHLVLTPTWHWIIKMTWNVSGFRPPLCPHRLSWARRTSWGWWDDWDDTVLQTQDSKFEPWRSEAEHATSRSRRLPTILTFTRGWGRDIFLFLSNRRDREPNPELWRERQLC